MGSLAVAGWLAGGCFLVVVVVVTTIFGGWGAYFRLGLAPWLDVLRGGGGHSFSWWGGVWKILIWVFLSGVKNLFSDIPIARPGPNTYPKSENVDAPKRAL